MGRAVHPLRLKGVVPPTTAREKAAPIKGN